MSIGRKHNAELDAMIDRLEAVAFEFAPALLARRKRKRLWEFIIAFMVDAMRMKAPDVEHHRSRADKLLRRGAQSSGEKCWRPNRGRPSQPIGEKSTNRTNKLVNCCANWRAAGTRPINSATIEPANLLALGTRAPSIGAARQDRGICLLLQWTYGHQSCVPYGSLVV